MILLGIVHRAYYDGPPEPGSEHHPVVEISSRRGKSADWDRIQVAFENNPEEVPPLEDLGDQFVYVEVDELVKESERRYTAKGVKLKFCKEQDKVRDLI